MSGVLKSASESTQATAGLDPNLKGRAAETKSFLDPFVILPFVSQFASIEHEEDHKNESLASERKIETRHS